MRLTWATLTARAVGVGLLVFPVLALVLGYLENFTYDVIERSLVGAAVAFLATMIPGAFLLVARRYRTRRYDRRVLR